MFTCNLVHSVKILNENSVCQSVTVCNVFILTISKTPSTLKVKNVKRINIKYKLFLPEATVNSKNPVRKPSILTVRVCTDVCACVCLIFIKAF